MNGQWHVAWDSRPGQHGVRASTRYRSNAKNPNDSPGTGVPGYHDIPPIDLPIPRLNQQPARQWGSKSNSRIIHLPSRGCRGGHEVPDHGSKQLGKLLGSQFNARFRHTRTNGHLFLVEQAPVHVNVGLADQVDW